MRFRRQRRRPRRIRRRCQRHVIQNDRRLAQFLAEDVPQGHVVPAQVDHFQHSAGRRIDWSGTPQPDAADVVDVATRVFERLFDRLQDALDANLDALASPSAAPLLTEPLHGLVEHNRQHLGAAEIETDP